MRVPRVPVIGLSPMLAVLLLQLAIWAEDVSVQAQIDGSVRPVQRIASVRPEPGNRRKLIETSHTVDGAVCAPQKVELSCHPTSGLVLSDNSPLEKHYGACAKIACHTDSLHIHNGYVDSSPGLVLVGESVNIRCNAGFELKYDSSKSARPRCNAGCNFDPPRICERKKCYTFSIDPNGRVQRMGQPAAVRPTKLDRLEYDDYVRITCNHGYMASDSAHIYNEACKVSYIRECQADGSLSNRDTSCVQLRCPSLNVEHASDIWKPAGALKYKKTAELECGWCRTFNGSSAARECSWRCQYTEAQGACVYKPCITGTRPSTTEWANGSLPSRCGDTGTLQCNQSGYVMAQDFAKGTCEFQESFECVTTAGSSEAGLDKSMRACSQRALCYQKSLQVPNGIKTDARPYVAFGEGVAARCNAGFRARPATATGPVQCEHSQDVFTVDCGVSELGRPLYAPCSWRDDISCLPVMCLLPSLAFGAYSTTPALPGVRSIQDNNYLDFGARLDLAVRMSQILLHLDASIFCSLLS